MARNPSKTRLDDDVTKPPTTAPGDAPYDTTDPSERATTVTPRPGPQALAEGRVNGTVPLPKLGAAERDSSKDRIETATVIGPDGKSVTVKRNLETGETVDASSSDSESSTSTTSPSKTSK